MKILIFGSSGMLGYSLLNFLSKHHTLMCGSVTRSNFTVKNHKKNICYFVINNFFDKRVLDNIFSDFKPNFVINCCGVIKQNNLLNIPTNFLINSRFPHLLNFFSYLYNFKLIQFSTDCVFSGKQGHYSELDIPDYEDSYGESKFFGEVYGENAATIRTSIIGHGIKPNNSLVDWFIKSNNVKGYKNAIFSGFPTIVLAEIIYKNLILNFKPGLFHVSNFAINKFDLLSLISNKYKLNKNIDVDTEFVIDRSLDGTKFYKIFNFKPIMWDQCIEQMYNEYVNMIK